MSTIKPEETSIASNPNASNASTTTPGPVATPSTSGMASSSAVSSLNHSMIEIENQFILRMPVIKQDNGTYKCHPATLALREALDKLSTSENPEKDPIKERLFIEMDSETRKGRVKFDDEIFEARLVDLPCIIESLKTTDRKMFYKTADICQMLVCKAKDEPWTSSETEDDSKDKDKKTKKPTKALSNQDRLKKYQWAHGITPPLKNVRRKRFRKMAKKKIIDYAEIEKEVKQLFRADREAIKIDYEVLYVEGDPEDDDDDKKDNSTNNDDDYDDSSQEENTIMHNPNDASKSEMENDHTIDNSTINNLNTTATAIDSNPPTSTNNKSKSKSKSIIEDSNMSSAQEYIDESSSIMAPPLSKSDKNAKIDEINDEFTNDNSNLNEDSKTSDTKNRTNFKNLFVKQVIGDLSSSSDDLDGDNEDEDDYDDEKTDKKKKTKIDASSKKDSRNIDFGDDSVSNMDDLNIGISANSVPSKTGDQEDEYEGDIDNEDESNLESAVTKSKLDDLGINDEDLSDDSEAENNNDDEEDVQAKTMEEDEESNLMKKSSDDFKNISLSSSSLSSSPAPESKNSGSEKQELNQKLNRLKEELHRIQEERRKREIEINPINNPVLKAHLSSRLNSLIDEENRKTKEIDDLTALLNE